MGSSRNDALGEPVSPVGSQGGTPYEEFGGRPDWIDEEVEEGSGGTVDELASILETPGAVDALGVLAEGSSSDDGTQEDAASISVLENAGGSTEPELGFTPKVRDLIDRQLRTSGINLGQKTLDLVNLYRDTNGSTTLAVQGVYEKYGLGNSKPEIIGDLTDQLSRDDLDPILKGHIRKIITELNTSEDGEVAATDSREAAGTQGDVSELPVLADGVATTGAETVTKPIADRIVEKALSGYEKKLLALAAEGKSNQEIAQYIRDIETSLLAKKGSGMSRQEKGAELQLEAINRFKANNPELFPGEAVTTDVLPTVVEPVEGAPDEAGDGDAPELTAAEDRIDGERIGVPTLIDNFLTKQGLEALADPNFSPSTKENIILERLTAQMTFDEKIKELRDNGIPSERAFQLLRYAEMISVRGLSAQEVVDLVKQGKVSLEVVALLQKKLIDFQNDPNIGNTESKNLAAERVNAYGSLLNENTALIQTRLDLIEQGNHTVGAGLFVEESPTSGAVPAEDLPEGADTPVDTAAATMTPELWENKKQEIFKTYDDHQKSSDAAVRAGVRNEIKRLIAETSQLSNEQKAELSEKYKDLLAEADPVENPTLTPAELKAKIDKLVVDFNAYQKVEGNNRKTFIDFLNEKGIDHNAPEVIATIINTLANKEYLTEAVHKFVWGGDMLSDREFKELIESTPMFAVDQNAIDSLYEAYKAKFNALKNPEPTPEPKPEEGESRTGIEDYIAKMEAELAVREFNRIATTWRREKFIESIKKIGMWGAFLLALSAIVAGAYLQQPILWVAGSGFLGFAAVGKGSTWARNWWTGGDPAKEAKIKREITNAKLLNQGYKTIEEKYMKELTPKQQRSITNVINGFNGKPGERFENIIQGAPEDVKLFGNSTPSIAAA